MEETHTLPGLKRILVANRGEIAIRVMRAATELGLRTIAIFSEEDRFSLHRSKADEAYLVGKGKSPVDAYLDIEDVLRIAHAAHVDAIHPGYGFLSENPDFADACEAAGMPLIGPTAATMRRLGNKISARALAVQAGVPVMPASPVLTDSLSECRAYADEIGYPVMLKASWGGGGRGMRVLENAAQLEELLPMARREAKAAFGNDEVYLEKLVRQARHIEVQIIGDDAGNLRAVKTVRVDWSKPQPGGAPFTVIEGSEQEWPCQMVLMALGFGGPEPTVAEQLGVEVDKRSNFAADYGRYTTNVEGVFAAGDCRRGQSLVVWAINEGREAAHAIDTYLMGASDLPTIHAKELVAQG